MAGLERHGDRQRDLWVLPAPGRRRLTVGELEHRSHRSTVPSTDPLRRCCSLCLGMEGLIYQESMVPTGQLDL